LNFIKVISLQITWLGNGLTATVRRGNAPRRLLGGNRQIARCEATLL
jgi:hypothetical protein